MEYEIYFSDLSKESQKELLETAGLTDPKEANWDVIPLATVYTFDDSEGEIPTDEIEGEVD